MDALGEARIPAETGGGGSDFVGDRAIAAHPTDKAGIRVNTRIGKIDFFIFSIGLILKEC
jgi:hypothetical protein